MVFTGKMHCSLKLVTKAVSGVKSTTFTFEIWWCVSIKLHYIEICSKVQGP